MASNGSLKFTFSNKTYIYLLFGERESERERERERAHARIHACTCADGRAARENERRESEFANTTQGKLCRATMRLQCQPF